jgi:hypothetical protein
VSRPASALRSLAAVTDVYPREQVRGFRRRLPKAFKVGRIVGKLNAIEGEYPPMDEDLARHLRATFADDNAALSTWLGRDLTRWTEGRA